MSDEPEQKENYARLVLETENKSKILVYVQNYPQYKYGDKLKIIGLLKKPENFGADFSYRLIWLKTEFITRCFTRKQSLFPAETVFG